MERRKLEIRSFAAGFATAVMVGITFGATAQAFDISKVTDLGKTVKNSIISLINIKKNLDTDVKNLTADAKTLIGDKDKLLLIKDQLFTLSKQTKEQVDQISKLVAEVEGHLKSTQTNITTTATHVGEVDKVRKSLSGQ